LATPPQFANWEEAAKELYGGYYAIVQSVPELQGLLRQAYNEKWSTARFEYEIKQTSWWKNNSDTTRQWDMMSQMDPATARQQVQNRTSEMLAMSLEQFGVSFSAGQLSKLATDSLRFGWSQQTLLNAIGLEATKSQRGMSQLAQGFIGQGIKATAYQYGLNLADNTFNQWIVDIASGKQARQGFTSYALQTAKTLYKGIASQLDAGLTFQQIVDPYRNYASQILELNPETISFIDPKWTRAVNFTDDKGQVRAMGLDEWGDYLRQDKQFGYEYTSQAQQRAYQVVNNLANLFGKA